jgi:hypothetical protein
MSLQLACLTSEISYFQLVKPVIIWLEGKRASSGNDDQTES